MKVYAIEYINYKKSFLFCVYVAGVFSYAFGQRFDISVAPPVPAVSTVIIRR